MIKLIVFDLDDTLYDCTGSILYQGFDKAKKAMLDAGLDPKFIPLITELNKTMGFSDVIKIMKKKIPERILKIGYNAIKNMEISGLKPFPDVIPTLKKIGIMKVLMSKGTASLQRKKIEILGLEDFFDDVFIVDQINTGEEKKDALNKILKKFNLKPENIMVVGDKIKNEIKDANQLGMVTVQMVHGKYSKVKPETEDEKPDYKIKKISDVLEILEKENR